VLECRLAANACRFGPALRKVDRWGGIERRPLHPDAVRQILVRRAAQAGSTGMARAPVSPHGLRAGFVAQAYQAGLRDEEIMGHSRHRDLETTATCPFGQIAAARLSSPIRWPRRERGSSRTAHRHPGQHTPGGGGDRNRSHATRKRRHAWRKPDHAKRNASHATPA
jgi:hypothetical protein